MSKDSKLGRAQKKAIKAEEKISPNVIDANSDVRVKRVYVDMNQLVCFICEIEDTKSNLSQVETIHTCKNLKDMITELNDVKFMKSVNGPDPIVLALMYHPTCLTGVHNR